MPVMPALEIDGLDGDTNPLLLGLSGGLDAALLPGTEYTQC